MNFLEENTDNFAKEYEIIRGGSIGFYRQKRGLIEVSGKEAVMFLNGLITNDVAKLENDSQMRAAFPNAQGRLLAAVRVLKSGDKFLFETEAETYEKILKNLQRFTFAGDFFVEDLTDKYECFEITNSKFQIPDSRFQTSDLIEFETNFGKTVFVPNEQAEEFLVELKNKNAVEISDELREVLRIENGEPKYAVDADETTIVSELGVDGLVSYNKGCYIGQEIIARIHFRGHVAKQLTGLILEEKPEPNAELKSVEGKNAGKITSVAFSPKLGKYIALAFVRYDFLAEGTQLKIGETSAQVKNLPFIERIG